MLYVYFIFIGRRLASRPKPDFEKELQNSLDTNSLYILIDQVWY